MLTRRREYIIGPFGRTTERRGVHAKPSISSASAAAAAASPARSARPSTAPRAAVIESGRLGGTCVNVGCVPKKVMWNAAGVALALADAGDYGFDVTRGRGNDWPALKRKRDAYVARLNGIYARNLAAKGVAHIEGRARFLDAHTLEVNGTRYQRGARRDRDRRQARRAAACRAPSSASPRTASSSSRRGRNAWRSSAAATSPASSPPRFTSSAARSSCSSARITC